jgi:hypothetical protein
MRKKSKRIIFNVVLATALLLGASYVAKVFVDRVAEIEGDKVDINSVTTYTFTSVDKKISFYQEDHEQIIWGFNYDSLPVYQTLDFLVVNKQKSYVEITLKQAYYLPLQLVATDLTGSYTRTIDLMLNYVESITIDETEIIL